MFHLFCQEAPCAWIYMKFVSRVCLADIINYGNFCNQFWSFDSTGGQILLISIDLGCH